jgi:hypothetical protein
MSTSSLEQKVRATVLTLTQQLDQVRVIALIYLCGGIAIGKMHQEVTPRDLFYILDQELANVPIFVMNPKRAVMGRVNLVRVSPTGVTAA